MTGAFAMTFTSTPRGARLARLLAVQRLDEWGVPYDSVGSRTVALLVGELAANAVRHGHVAGRDFPLGGGRLAGGHHAARLRIEVSDARSETRPTLGRPGRYEEHGRGLLVVDALSASWGVAERDVGKTVWCEYALEPGPL
jgi:anti-sigma regulatory factor (Ser/Thr protein kinase)